MDYQPGKIRINLMIVMAGYPQPDFSGYYTATGSIGFILLLAEYTVLSYVIVSPLPKHTLGVMGIIFLAHGLYGKRKDKKIQRQREGRLDRTLTDYRTNSSNEEDFAEVARGENGFADGGGSSDSEPEQVSDDEREEEVEQ